MGEQEPPLQSLLEQHKKVDRALGKISAVVPLLDRRVEDTTGLPSEAYIKIAVRTGRVKRALLENAQPTLLSRKEVFEERIRSRIERLEGEVAEIRQLVEGGYLPETALRNSEEILASLRRDFGSQKSAESPPEETVFRAPAAVQPERPPQHTDTVQLPEWVLEAVSNEDPLIFRGRDLTSYFECAPVSLRAMRVFVQTSKERPVARSVWASATYPNVPNLKVARQRLSLLCSNSLNPKLYELGLNSMSISPWEGNQIGEVHYYLIERSADGQGGEGADSVVVADSSSGDGHAPLTVFEPAAVPPPSVHEAIATEKSEFEFLPDRELFLVACALKSRAFIHITGNRLSRREFERLERIIEGKKEQVVIPADDLEELVLQTASKLPIYQVHMKEMIAHFGAGDDRVFVLAVLFNQLHHGKKPEDLFLEIADAMRPKQARREEEAVEVSQEDLTDEQERVAYGLFAIHPERTKFLSFGEIIKDVYADSFRGITGEDKIWRQVKALRKRRFEPAQTAIIEKLRRLKLNSSDAPPRVTKLLSGLREQPEYRNAALDDLILVAQREIIFREFLERADSRRMCSIFR